MPRDNAGPKPYLWIGYFKRKMRYLAPQRPYIRALPALPQCPSG